jgi:hypothetical protein
MEKPTCPICNVTFSKKSNLKDHLNTYKNRVHPKNIIISSEELICFCHGIQFISKASLKSHLRREANKKEVICPVCLLKLSSESSLEKHLKIYGNNKYHKFYNSIAPFICDCHNREFNTREQLLKHCNDFTKKEEKQKYQIEYKLKNKEILRKKEKQERIRLKQEVITHYGGKCNCCSEILLDFLTIDHINNNGAEHRRELKITSGNVFYRWLKNNNYPEGYQVLCSNCNLSKRINNGKCIHQILKKNN